MLNFNIFFYHNKEAYKRIELKTIKDFPRYQISDTGIVFDTHRQRAICRWIDTVGYYQCILMDDDKKKHYKRVHRLVAQSFIPNPENFPQVNHKDGNKLNNSVGNLEWVTNSYNTQHGYDNGLYHSKHRSHTINVYTKDGNYLATYQSIRSMCRELNINRKTVTMILKGEKITNNYNYLFEYVEGS